MWKESWEPNCQTIYNEFFQRIGDVAELAQLRHYVKQWVDKRYKIEYEK